MAYESHVGPFGSQMAPSGRQMGLCGSSMHSMGPILYWCHSVGAVLTVLGAVCTRWAPCMPYGSHMEPNGRQMGGSCVPYGSRWCHMGAVWKLCGPHQRWMVPYGTCWHRMGAIWEPSAPCSRRMAYGIHVVPDGSHMAPCGRWMVSYGSRMSQMGPYESHVHITGDILAIWEYCAPCGN
jgi:hypothetical protein